MAPETPIPAEENTPLDSSARLLARRGRDELLLVEGIGGPARLPVKYSADSCLDVEGKNLHPQVGHIEFVDPGVVVEFPGWPGLDPDREYVHCGEPMTMGSTARGPVTSTLLSSPVEKRRLEIYLRTRVLHCQCGFQMEFPRPARG